jgi:Pretoxin HINT domain
VRDLIRRLLLVLACIGAALFLFADGAAAAEQTRESAATAHKGPTTPTGSAQNGNAVQGSLLARSGSVYTYDARFKPVPVVAVTVRGEMLEASGAASSNPATPKYDATHLLRISRNGMATKRVPCASFRADTLVLMADGSKKPIGEIEVGDKVIATDPVTGETSVREVTRLFTHIDDDLLDLVVLTDDGVETIHTTDHHRFWNDTSKTWVEAKDLKSGDRLLTPDGDLVTIGELKRVPGSAPMLDLTIEYDHTFYVALNDTAVLVHNQTCDLDAFSAAAGKPAGNGLTEAGRAPQKHGNPVGKRVGNGFLTAPSMKAADLQTLIDDLLTAPNTAVQRYVHPSFGAVTDFRGPTYGARFGPNGEFIGFL